MNPKSYSILHSSGVFVKGVEEIRKEESQSIDDICSTSREGHVVTGIMEFARVHLLILTPEGHE
jgi:hypothetical protein